MSHAHSVNNGAETEKIYALEKQLVMQKRHTFVAQDMQKRQKSELEELRRELDAIRQQEEQLSYALTAANRSHAKQSQLLMTELQKTQHLLSHTHTQLTQAQAQLEHMHRTLSWRVTEPLRTWSPRHITRRIAYAFFGALKDVWTDFGEPFPELTRKIRYGVFAKIPPNKR